MKIRLGSIYKTKEQWDSEYIICPIENYHRDKYLNRRLLIRTIFWCIFAFGFGYKLYWPEQSLKAILELCYTFLLAYVLSFYLMQIPHEFIHLLFYPKTFTDKNIDINFFNNKRVITSISHSPITSIRLCFVLILPFILFTIIPSIFILNYYYNIYIYAFAAANSILSSDDLLNIILQFFAVSENKEKYLYEIPNSNEYFKTNINEISNEVEK